MKSVIQDNTEICYHCKKYLYSKDKHHIFNGTANRKKSEEDGMFIFVHRACHIDIHSSEAKLKKYKIIGQIKYEETRTREQFIKRYGRSYIL